MKRESGKTRVVDFDQEINAPDFYGSFPGMST